MFGSPKRVNDETVKRVFVQGLKASDQQKFQLKKEISTEIISKEKVNVWLHRCAVGLWQMARSGPGQAHIHVHPALLKTHLHWDSVEAAPNQQNGALAAVFGSSPPSEAIILLRLHLLWSAAGSLDPTTTSSVPTRALSVRLGHWIRCHFLYTNAKKSKTFYWCLIVATTTTTTKISCSFLHCKCGHNMSVHIHMDAVHS